MKKRFLTAFLSVMMVVCLSVSATAFLASAAAVPDDDTYTTNVDLTDKSNFKGVFAGSGNKVIAGEADEIWDFDTQNKTITSKGDLSTNDEVWSNFYYLYYDKADYKNFYMEVTLQHVGTRAGWSGLCFGVENTAKPAKGALENPKGGLTFVQGEGQYTWHNPQINSNEWNDTAIKAKDFNGLNDTVHKLKVYKNHIQYWLNDEDPIVVDLQPGDEALTSGKVGVAVTNKTVSVKSFKVTYLKADGTVGTDETIPATDIEVSGIENNGKATVGTPVPVTVNVLPKGSDGEYTFTSDKDGVYLTDGKLLFKNTGEYNVTFTAKSNPEIKKTFKITAEDADRTGYIAYPLTEEGMSAFESIGIAGNSGNGGAAAKWDDLFTLQDGVLARKVTAAGQVGNDYGVLYFNNRDRKNFELVYSAKGNSDNGWFGAFFAMTNKMQAGNQTGGSAFMQNASAAHNATIWGGTPVGGPYEGGSPSYVQNEFSTFKLRVFEGQIDFFVDDMVTPRISKTVEGDLTGAIALFADGGCNAQFKDVYFGMLDDEGNLIDYKAVESISIANKAQTAYVGDKLDLTANVLPADATDKSVAFSSSDPTVAAVNAEGKVTFLSEGTVTITASSKDDASKKDSFTVTVSKKVTDVAVTSVSIQNKPTAATVGDKLTLTVKVSPDNATNKNLAFESSDKTIATVSETGVVTFLKAGSVTITVKSEADSSKSDSFTVTVSEKKEEKSGCGSSVAAASMIFAAGALAAAVLFIAKKRAE